MDKFYPDILDYLENIETETSVSAEGLEDFVAQVRARTGLETEICKQIVALFFQGIRNRMLRGDIVKISGLGNFFIASPFVTNTKGYVFPKYKPYKSLIKKINHDS